VSSRPGTATTRRSPGIRHCRKLDDWLSLYAAAARLNGGEPDAGRRLLSWAQRAGFSEIEATSSTWCFATEADRAWWGGMWSELILHSDLADQLLRSRPR
jgi:hypothetical protein